MKKIFCITTAFIIAFSCGKLQDQKAAEPKTPAEMVELSFTATADLTKALLDGKNVEFSPNDKISIFKNGTNYQFTTEEGGANAVFTGSISDADLAAEGDYYALFPYSASAAFSDGKITNVKLSKYSSATAGTFAPQQAIFVARSSSLNLYFKSVVALLKIRVPEGIEDLKDIAVFNRQAALSGAITGTFSVTPGAGDEDPQVEITASNGSNGDPHTAGLNTSSGFITPGVYYIPVLPSSLTQGFDMKLQFGNPKVFDGRIATGSNLTFVAGKVYNLGTIRRENFFVMDGFENETVDIKSTKWTGNDAFVRANPYKDASKGNTSNKVLEMNMRNRTESSPTSGFLDYSIPISNTYFLSNFSSISIKVYYDQSLDTDKYYPHMLWNKDGSATLPALVNGKSITDKASFDSNWEKDKWNTLTWNASQWTGKTNLSTLTSLKIRFFVDWSNGSLKRADGYTLYVCIDELTFNQ